MLSMNKQRKLSVVFSQYACIFVTKKITFEERFQILNTKLGLSNAVSMNVSSNSPYQIS